MDRHATHQVAEESGHGVVLATASESTDSRANRSGSGGAPADWPESTARFHALPTQEVRVVEPTRAVLLGPSRLPKRPRRSSPSHRGERVVVVMVAILGLLAAAVAVAYSAIPADSLPSFLGRRPQMHRYRIDRAEASALVALGMLLLAIVLTVRARFPELAGNLWHRLLGR